MVFRIWVSPWVSKQKNRLSEYIGKPYFMLFKAIILRLGKQKLV
nr:MAG TPA: Type IV conjugative transfer system lipoprotein (TraV) [Caudoviricetes sp.]